MIPEQSIRSTICTAVIFFTLAVNVATAQISSSDSLLIANRSFTELLETPRNVTGLRPGKSALARYNPISLTFTGLMYFYQKVVSRQLATRCPYTISCSNFSKQCIAEYGLLKGIALSADRLTRCNRIAAYDIHPMTILEGDKIYDPIELYRIRD